MEPLFGHPYDEMRFTCLNNYAYLCYIFVLTMFLTYLDDFSSSFWEQYHLDIRGPWSRCLSILSISGFVGILSI